MALIRREGHQRMANSAQPSLDQKLDTALALGVGIIAERHAILDRLAAGFVSAAEHQRLTVRFHDLGVQWDLLTAAYQTMH
jgi:hypothetical protein